MIQDAPNGASPSREAPESAKPKRRIRRTRRSVVVAERIARVAITAGGIGTIAAVSLIFVFLAWVVVPLFHAPRLIGDESFAAEATGEAPLRIDVDEDRLLSWTLGHDGRLELHALETGERIGLTEPFGADPPTATSFSSSGEAVFGFADGTIRLGRVEFRSEFLGEADLPGELLGLKIGASTVFGGGIVQRTTIGQLRHTTLAVELEEPLEAATGSAVLRIDHSVTPAGIYLVSLLADGSLRVSREREKKNWMTGEVTKTLRHAQLETRRDDGASRPVLPEHVKIGGLGQHVFVTWRDGRVDHWDLRDVTAPEKAETLDVLAGREGAELTAVDFVAGKQTLVFGDSTGGVRTWFLSRSGDQDDAPLLTLARELGQGASPVLALAASARSRAVVATFGSGAVRVYQATLGDELLELESEQPALAAVIPPKEDGVVLRTTDSIAVWDIDLEYPEANLSALFRPIWYEGYPGAEHVWQSSSASDDFEPKLGLVPLVFGTIKATIYSMLFAAPLAILAALYTSEFMAARMRSSVKATVELMASLPSVVLGFIAALVIAPFVQDVLPAVMLSFVTIPLATLAGAYLWQLLPVQVALRWSGWQRFSSIALTLPLGLGAAVILGPLFESLLFAGDIEAWLVGQVGGPFGGWFFLLLPMAALAVTIACGLFASPMIRARSATWGRARVARLEALKFVGIVLVTFAFAAIGAALLGLAGLDARGGAVDTYIQRNALIVGFAMGFAVVPIIYTLSEDSLSEVPPQLREGSLGAGATQWQTAIRIVVPFAMSGIFSALMIGLGRAVGETMIVLMAAGNTPIMEWNVFNGFRTLSANIAVEMPEAVVGSAHYRTLFVAALVLFAITFALNTVAELVRRHFRRRTHAL